MLSRDHYVSKYYSKYPKQEEEKRRKKSWARGRGRKTIKELAHVRLGLNVGHQAFSHPKLPEEIKPRSIIMDVRDLIFMYKLVKQTPTDQ